jgi:hypothetical protein
VPRGGKRPGSGRKKGPAPAKVLASNAQLRSEVFAEAKKGKKTPLEIMLAAMHSAWPAEKDKAVQYASLAAPYIHPRLSTVNATATVEHKGDGEDSVRRLAMFMMAYRKGSKTYLHRDPDKRREQVRLAMRRHRARRRSLISTGTPKSGDPT